MVGAVPRSGSIPWSGTPRIFDAVCSWPHGTRGNRSSGDGGRSRCFDSAGARMVMQGKRGSESRIARSRGWGSAAAGSWPDRPGAGRHRRRRWFPPWLPCVRRKGLCRVRSFPLKAVLETPELAASRIDQQHIRAATVRYRAGLFFGLRRPDGGIRQFPELWGYFQIQWGMFFQIPRKPTPPSRLSMNPGGPQ